MPRPRVIVVVKRTAYRYHVEEKHDGRVAALLAKGDPTVRRMLGSHAEHEATVRELREALAEAGAKVTWMRRAHAPFDARKADLVITVGGDGTLLGASHSVGDTPVLGINSAPTHSVGFFCGAVKGKVGVAVHRALAGELRTVVFSRMEVTVAGKAVSRRVLNEALVCHASPAATSRYILELGGRTEEQKSSGLWIGPAAGSTAAQHSAGGRILPLTSRALQLVVREPYTPAAERLRLTRALVADGQELVVRSKMSDARIFLDGPYEVRKLQLGDTIVFRRSKEPLRVLGLSARRRGWTSGNR